MVSHVQRLAGVAVFSVFLAGCQGVPAEFKPDPKLRTESVGALKARVARACVMSQRAKSSASTQLLQRNCACYVGKTFAVMDKSEIDFYRQNGYFSDITRPKGEAALRACNLQP